MTGSGKRFAGLPKGRAPFSWDQKDCFPTASSAARFPSSRSSRDEKPPIPDKKRNRPVVGEDPGGSEEDAEGQTRLPAASAREQQEADETSRQRGKEKRGHDPGD